MTVGCGALVADTSAQVAREEPPLVAASILLRHLYESLYFILLPLAILLHVARSHVAVEVRVRVLTQLSLGEHLRGFCTMAFSQSLGFVSVEFATSTRLPRRRCIFTYSTRDTHLFVHPPLESSFHARSRFFDFLFLAPFVARHELGHEVVVVVVGVVVGVVVFLCVCLSVASAEACRLPPWHRLRCRLQVVFLFTPRLASSRRGCVTACARLRP